MKLIQSIPNCSSNLITSPSYTDEFDLEAVSNKRASLSLGGMANSSDGVTAAVKASAAAESCVVAVLILGPALRGL
jgi:hypothetical protein